MRYEPNLDDEDTCDDLFTASRREAFGLLGERLKGEALSAMEDHYATILTRIRGAMASRSLRVGGVSGDDVRDFLDAEFPGWSNGGRASWTAAVWREKGWQMIGTVKSKHPGNHARRINVYRWVGP